MTNKLSVFWSKISCSSLCELVELFGDKICLPDTNQSHRNRVFNQWRTFWLFFGQILSASQTCREALRKAQMWFYLENKNKSKKMISTNTSAYCQARSRLNQDYLDKVNLHVCERVQTKVKPKHLWFGRHVKVVDGSSISMPDTKENQERYPQPAAQKKGCGFPVMRWVGMFSLTTGILLKSKTDSLNTHERILWHEMWDCYEEDDIVLADRGFCSLADFWILSNRKVDCVMRLHQRRKKGEHIVKSFSKNDRLVEWKKSRQSPKWLSKEQWANIPKSIIVREITVTIDNPGFRTKTITLATTLLDHKKYTLEDFSQLYRRRWLAELFIKDMKTTMRMEILHCKTPDLIQKEFTLFSITYNLIRSLIWEAALQKDIDPYRISFKGAIVTITQWMPLLASIKSSKEKKDILKILLEVVASDIVKDRERERQPRALKRRMKSYQLLTKPRGEFIEIPHRHKYRKNAKNKNNL